MGLWSCALHGHLAGHVSKRAEKRGTQLGRTNGLSAKDGTHRSNEVRSRCILQQIARYARTDGSQELFFVGIHGDDHDSKRSLVSTLTSNIRGEPACFQRVDDQDVALRMKQAASCPLRMSALSNN